MPSTAFPAPPGSPDLPARPGRPLVVRDGWIVPLDAAGTRPFRGYLLVGADGRIQASGPGEPPPDVLADHRADGLDVGGAIVLPGFVSAHSHLWQSPLRGLAATSNTMDWIGGVHGHFGPHLEPGDMYHFTRHGAFDLLRGGATTVYNHTHDLGTGADEQWTAAFSVPQRTVYGFSPPMWADAAARRAGIARFAALAAEGRGDPRLLGLGVNTTGVLSGTDTVAEVALLRSHGLAMQAHYLEDPSFAAGQRADWPELVAAGRVAPDVLFAHFIHTSPAIVADAARLGAGMVRNPLSNGRLGSGLPDILGYRQAGLPVGMGLDGQASADVADPFQNLRAGLYALRMVHQSAAVMTCEEILRLHTVDSAALLGLADEVGSLAPGRWGDFVVVDPDEPDSGPVHDLYPHLVFATSASNIRSVHIGGTPVFERPAGGRLTWVGPGGDGPGEAGREVRARAARLRPAVARGERPAQGAPSAGTPSAGTPGTGP